MTVLHTLHLSLPDWLPALIDPEQRFDGDDSRVALAIELSRRNVDHASGGPFGAVIFDDTGRVVAAGVNRVVPQNCSAAHAEMMAFMLAQHRLGRARINEDGRHYTLATSSQPCCQCYGASFWAGIDTVLIGARSEDVMRLTEFDEGPLPADWVGEMQARGIAVRRDIQRDLACTVLADYGQLGGVSY